MQHVVKVFPPDVVALNDVSVDFRQGEIHAIVGENGAGKSTLMKILYAMENMNAGEIFYNAKPVHFQSTGDAIANGIGMVHQEILLIPEYSIWENVVLGLEPTRGFGKLDEKKAIADVLEKIDEFGFHLDPLALVKDISVAAQQKVEILKLLYRNVSVLIMDEPTAVLTPQEIPQLFDELRRLRDNGHTILFISHHLDEVLDLSDRITVLQKGKMIGTVTSKSTSKKELARMMVGREVIFSSIRKPCQHGDTVFEARNICYRDEDKVERLKDINFTVSSGEIVGIAGVEGNGQFELVNTIMGLITPQSGSIFVQGKDITEEPILERRKLLSYVSQDRKTMGSSASAPISENMIMTHHKLEKRFQKWNGLVLNFHEVTKFAEEIRKRFSVNMGAPGAPFQSLSGGNQQKVILGRELSLSSPFVLLDQPTRGLDVGSIEYVHEQILGMRDQQRAILMLSSDLDELFRIADRLLVLYRGKIVADLITGKTTINEIGYLMLEGTIHEN
ncbi:MAG TPA: ABC transporter ATP-binding protein [Anaerolineaceae bacterium]|nr:ABC transporter ATP-binding protein [Anaerolineaceae bacterium]